MAMRGDSAAGSNELKSPSVSSWPARISGLDIGLPKNNGRKGGRLKLTGQSYYWPVSML
jgi:hypothetical protein